MSEVEQQVEVVEGQADKPEAATVATPAKVDEGAAPAEKPIERTYTQAEVDGISARIAAREERKRLRELEAIVNGRKEPPKTEAPIDPVAPKREQFEDYEAYVEAKASYVAERKFQELTDKREREAREAKVKEEHATAEQQFHERMRAAEASIPDFEVALNAAAKLPLSDQIYGAIIRLPEGPQLVHYFGTHPEEAHRILQLHPTVHAAEVGKIVAKLGSAPAPKPASVSRAPEPIDTTRSGTTVVTDKPPDDPNEYKQWHDAQMRARYSGKRT